MKIPSPLRWAALAVLSSLTLASVSFAQTTNTWFTGFVTNQWTNDTNWSPANFPNAVDSRAIFASTATNTTNNTIQATWAGTNITVGSIFNTPATNGTAVVGDNSFTTDTLTLATTSGKPELFVSNASSTIFMYATVLGSNGFTKTGPGQLTFRFNTNDHPYTGDVVLLGGTLGVNQASSLGNASNSLLVGSNSTLTITPGSNTGVISFEATRSFVVSNGVTFNIQTISNAVSGVFSNAITGAGRVDFIGPTAGTNEASATKFSLAGSNAWTGRTTVQMGAKVTLGTGSSIGSGDLSVSGGSGSYAGLDLGGNTQSVASFQPASASTTVRTIVISNGSLSAGGGAGNIFANFSGTNGTTLDMSGLTAFAYAGAASNRVFTITPNGSTDAVTNNTNYVFLAAAGTGSNSISVASVTVGGASGSPTAGNQARLILGKINEFNATSFTVGGFNGSGVVDFGSGITNGSVKLRGSNGTAPLGTLIVGTTSSGVRSGAGTLNLGTADASISNTLVGIPGAGASGPATTNQITLAGGTFESLGLVLGVITNTSLASNNTTTTAIFQQDGGTAKVQTVTLGNSASTSNVVAPTFLANYNLSSSNAILRAQTIQAGTTTTNYSSSTRRKVNFGAGRIETYDASTDLVIQGIDTTAQGRIEIAVSSNAQTKTFFADTGRKITLEPSAVLTFDGGITKDGAGTLVLKGANTHNGNTTVAAGTLELQSTGSLRFQIGGSGTNNKINGAGTASLDGQFVFNLASASTNNGDTWNIVSNSVSTTYGTNFLVTGFSGAGGSWTNTTNGVDYVFSQSSGNLTVVSTSSPTPYNAWVSYWQTNSAGFTNTAGTADPDGDQFDNNEEFAFDGNPTVGTPALLTATKSGTNTIFNYVARNSGVTYQVRATTNLATGPWSNSLVTVSNSANTNGINIPADYTRKEFTVPGAGNEFYKVEASFTP